MFNFKSKITEKLLAYYFINLNERQYVNELSRILNVDPGNLDRKLKELEKEGLFVSENQGNMKYYSLNKNYPLLKEVKKAFDVSCGLEKKIANLLSNLKGLKSAYIFGSYSKGGFGPESDIDLLLIGSHSSIESIEILYKLSKEIRREINIIDMTEKEYLEKKKRGDDFVKNIFEGKTIKII